MLAFISKPRWSKPRLAALGALAVIVNFSTLNPVNASAETGWHLLGGAGLSTAGFETDNDSIDIGPGANLRTDLAYGFTAYTAFEFGSTVTFTRIEEDKVLLWNTLLTLGIRTRLPYLSHSDRRHYYFRFFGGYGTAVGFYNGPIPANVDPDATRSHFMGPATGISLGLRLKSAQQRIYYLEIAAVAHRLKQVEVIREDGVIPVIVSGQGIEEANLTLGTLLISVGAQLF